MWPLVLALLLAAFVRSSVQQSGSGDLVCSDGDLRLRDGAGVRDGRVEICHSNAWGTICDDLWDGRDAQVACRQLGFAATGARATSNAGGDVYVTPGTGPILLDSVQCNGDEERILDCSRQGVGVHDCSHFEDAGVFCEEPGFSCEDGEVRLVDGSSEYDGRVEVCSGNAFGSICDDGTWDDREARIVCQQLGYGGDGALAILGGNFGLGLGTIYLFGLRCTGEEEDLFNCTIVATINTFFCTHSDDAGVLCPRPDSNCTNGDVRLINGRIPSEGRVEVCYNGHWGTICHDGWDGREASVVCAELGYSRNDSVALGFADFGSGDGLILLSNLGCSGEEQSLAECSHRGLARHICNHREDAGAICKDPENTCTDGDVRLVDGETPNEGRLEICVNDHWGTVCDDDFDATDASVVCRQLGYPNNGSVGLYNAFFGPGVGIIFFDDVECVGNESSLLECQHIGLGTSNCFHNEDLSILCQAENASCVNGEIRLEDGTGNHSGRVEVCFNGRWGTVCDDSWGVDDAAVVCRQLGFPTEGAVGLGGAFYGEGSGPIFLDDVTCSPENDSTLLQCFQGRDSVGVHNCVHGEDASVICASSTHECVNGDLRLVGGTNELEGRVELCLDGFWGTVCDNFWSDLDAAVVCRQLTHGPTDAIALKGGHFGAGEGPIHVDSFFCLGDEEALSDCIHSRSEGCTHNQDASVICKTITCEDGDVRLVGGTIPSEGRVEVCFDQQYGTICDDAWDNNDAAVVCRQLGYQAEGAIALPRAFFGSGTRRIVLDQSRCTGTESSIIDCDYERNPVFCFHFEDAGVLCQTENSSLVCDNGDIRLVGGNGPHEGRVEVCFNGQWGTVCEEGWSNRDAEAVCGILGFQRTGALGASGAHFGQGRGPIFLDEVSCVGNETSIFDCLSQDPGVHNCRHFQDTGVICPLKNSSFECTSGDLRLVEGSAPHEGRVELCINGVWGTVCDDFWGRNDAMVVCRQMGFGSEGAQAVIRAGFGRGTGPIYLDDVGCNGNESTLLECPSVGVGSFCFHSEDVGVICKAPPCYDGEIRLVDGVVESEGRVQVCVEREWRGAVCDFLWDNDDAAVVCRQLGYETEGAVSVRGGFFGRGGEEVNYRVVCEGSETELLNCSNRIIFFCFGSGAGVICPTDDANCTNGDVRLVGGARETEGRVEVCLHGRWGSVCDDQWDSPEATVVCNQLNFTRNGYPFAVRNAGFGRGEGLILLDDVACEGTEATLLGCPARETGEHNCLSSEDAGVICPDPEYECSNGAIRLVGGRSDSEGRVEVCLRGRWGTVCADRYWTQTDAQVVCNQLGYTTEGAIELGGDGFGGGQGPIQLQQLNCNGSEAAAVLCPVVEGGLFSFFCSSHASDAGVICKDPTLNCTEGDVRLVDGVADFEGRVEVCFDNQWGTVCDDQWDDDDASVVCKQLGFSGENAVAVPRGFFGRGLGLIHLDEVECERSLTSIMLCPNLREHNCVHAEDAGVICQVPNPDCRHGDVRLVGGATETKGRVEVCIGGRWGTVCDDQWDDRDASVVCRQLGFSPNGSVATDTAFFGRGEGPIFLDDTRCLGNEPQLLDCPSSGTGIHNCNHFEDAGILCQLIPCEKNSLRLVGGLNMYQGRVEMCVGGEWGTVCGETFTAADASTVCSGLSLNPTGAIGVSNGVFGEGMGAVYDFTTRETSQCTHETDAGVFCREPSSVSTVCATGDLRLVGGESESEGRVEVCINNQWGTICDDSWDDRSARVVCSQLNLPTEETIAVGNAGFGEGSGPILLDDVKCQGEEISILSCPQLPLNASHDCSHSEDVGVNCFAPPCYDGEIRLVDGVVESEGRVQVCVEREWRGAVCDFLWDNDDAAVVCRQLGYETEGAVSVRGGFFGRGGEEVNYRVVCEGSETELLNCSNRIIFFCFGSGAGVICPTDDANCTNGDVRLVGGARETEGRVEVCLHGRWGSVCDDQWDSPEATVVCNQLNFTGNGYPFAVRNAGFGRGEGLILLDDVACEGTEATLLGCPAREAGEHNCLSSEDAGVICPDPEYECSNGAIRLVGGRSDSEGRVEVCLRGRWGTVCTDLYWTQTDAQVVCNQLGYTTEGAIELGGDGFGGGQGPIQLQQLNCNGSEAAAVLCPVVEGGLFNFLCFSHASDAGVICKDPTLNCTEGDVRLVDGVADFEGRVEVCFDNQWGTVCDDQWDDDDASVVCKQLGFSGENAVAVPRGFFGRGVGLIHLDEVECERSLTSIMLCPNLREHNCAHAEDAGVICQVPNPDCRHGDVRLVGGATEANGRVEVCIGGRWGTVCDDQWDDRDASVVCRQLGFSPNGSVATDTAFFGRGEGPIFLDDTRCLGNEPQLLDCPSSGTGVHNCDHIEDAGILCPPPPCYDGEIRLVDGVVESEGRVQVCVEKEWRGAVCDFLWDNDDAAVVCRQLGYETEGAVSVRGGFFGRGGEEVNYRVVCEGSETELLNCSNRIISFCFGSGAGVICPTDNANCTNGDIRLVGGARETEGRVEVCLHGRWGSVCDDQWDSPEATVVCNQLNFTGNGYPFAVRNAGFGRGEGLILLDDVACEGTEATLLGCPAREAGEHNCLSSEDAGVICPDPEYECSNGAIRLVGGRSDSEGRVEVCLRGRWGTVCADLYWTQTDAQVVCNQLGYTTEGAIELGGDGFGGGQGPIQLQQLNCNGSEAAAVLCPVVEGGLFNFVCFSHASDAGVVCKDPTLNCMEGDVRLVDGVADFEGRVEVCFDNQWGTVCDDQWDDDDASVVCKQLGFSGENAVAVPRGFFGRGVGLIHLDEVECERSFTSIMLCPNLREHNCAHAEDAGVICQVPNPDCRHGDVRLVGGATEANGRVEVCIGGRWGTVCDDQWDDRDASVVCRQLGFSPNGSVATDTAFFGRGEGPIFLDDTRCLGNESQLLDCLSGTGVHNCDHIEDAGIMCQLIPCEENSLRLVGGLNMYQGRVEMCVGGEWGTVCGETFTAADASTVCSGLSLNPTGAIGVSNGVFGEGMGAVYDFTTRETSQCTHETDAGVFCREPSSVSTVCATGDLRLVGGESESEGRVEVCINNQWGTICDDSWDDTSARVVCSQLNLPTEGAIAVGNAGFGEGSGPILLDDVKCQGEEISILSCPQLPLNASHDCSHSEDVGVNCHDVSVPTPSESPTTESPSESPTTTEPPNIVGSEEQREGGDDSARTVAIVVPIILIIIIIALVVVIIVAVVILYRARRVGKFRPRALDEQPITRTDSFSSEKAELGHLDSPL